LRSVADLTLIAEQHHLATTVQELTGDWHGYALRDPLQSVPQPTGFAPTQLLGAAVHAVPGIEGFRAVSAKVATRKNLVVFPDKLQPGSQILFTDTASGSVFTIP
jgi:hypothetical protein